MKKCPQCKKIKPDKDFTRKSTEDGIEASDFIYCNKCICGDDTNLRTKTYSG